VLAQEEVPAPAAALASLGAQADFCAVLDALKSMQGEASGESVSALLGLLSHVRRMKLLPILSSCVQVSLPRSHIESGKAATNVFSHTGGPELEALHALGHVWFLNCCI
jgi:hypothetical protein